MLFCKNQKDGQGHKDAEATRKLLRQSDLLFMNKAMKVSRYQNARGRL